MKPTVRKYLSEIGRKGGKKSRRTITREQQEKMQAARRERRLLKQAKIEATPLVGADAVRRAMERKQKQQKGE